MQIIHSIQLHSGSNEENLPGFTPEFPYIASRAELDHYREFFVPWHWHKAVELFYMESGEIRYHTPGGTEVFPAGTGGMVNSNVLHMTPTEYLTSIRLQMACRMLAETRESVTDIGHACGLGSSSYFGKTFREHTGYAPLEYRRKWQDNGRISRWEADGYQWPHRYPA